MVDVLKPELLHLGNFCYRVNPGDANSSDSQSNIQSQDDLEQLDYQESGLEMLYIFIFSVQGFSLYISSNQLKIKMKNAAVRYYNLRKVGQDYSGDHPSYQS